ncbi:hypothetical protein [Hyalangium rubrum]|uniref:Uncharacterized protein n=1 Tax=Hyalangium rubrum TaxID=3103134 RepID=A0ABU5GXB4_9BACT|nr:hypothetical protein [Hyalangium sp. s54d21]MDY7225825.1 hypothetical protein [Hyalangium sp. s54d21]
MLVTARPSLAPGVCAAAAAPLTILLSFGLLGAWASESEVLSRLMGSSGAFGSLVVISGLVEMAFLTVMLCHIGTGREVPLAVLLGVATLPWTVGLLGTEVHVGRVVAALGELEASDARNTLALGVGEAMASRVLGAWVSAALLVGLSLGLALNRAGGEPPLVGSPRGHFTKMMFGVVAALALAAIALVGAMEAYQLFGLLTRLAQVPLAERTDLLAQAVDEVARLRPMRWGCMAVLGTLAVASLAWKARRTVRSEGGWVENGILLASVAALLVLDGHPLRSATERAHALGLGPVSLPTGFEALRTTQAYAPQPLAVLATPEGLAHAGGERLSWNTPTQALAATLSSGLQAPAQAGPGHTGLTPEPMLPLLADARLSGTAIQRLLEASTRAGARSVELVGQQPHTASPATLERFQAHFPFFSLLAARPGTLRLLLPSALSGSASLSWRARFVDGTRLQLSPAEGGGALTLSLNASPADVPEVLAGTLVGLEVSGDVSLKQLGAAADVLALAGASPVVMLDAGASGGPLQSR